MSAVFVGCPQKVTSGPPKVRPLFFKVLGHVVCEECFFHRVRAKLPPTVGEFALVSEGACQADKVLQSLGTVTKGAFTVWLVSDRGDVLPRVALPVVDSKDVKRADMQVQVDDPSARWSIHVSMAQNGDDMENADSFKVSSLQFMGAGGVPVAETSPDVLQRMSHESRRVCITDLQTTPVVTRAFALDQQGHFQRLGAGVTQKQLLKYNGLIKKHEVVDRIVLSVQLFAPQDLSSIMSLGGSKSDHKYDGVRDMDDVEDAYGIGLPFGHGGGSSSSSSSTAGRTMVKPKRKNGGHLTQLREMERQRTSASVRTEFDVDVAHEHDDYYHSAQKVVWTAVDTIEFVLDLTSSPGAKLEEQEAAVERVLQERARDHLKQLTQQKEAAKTEHKRLTDKLASVQRELQEKEKHLAELDESLNVANAQCT